MPIAPAAHVGVSTASTLVAHRGRVAQVRATVVHRAPSLVRRRRGQTNAVIKETVVVARS